MNEANVRSYARALVTQDIANQRFLKEEERLYKGEDNLCLRVIFAFQNAGISDREQRLKILRDTFDRPGIISTKDLTVAEAQAILAFKADL